VEVEKRNTPSTVTSLVVTCYGFFLPYMLLFLLFFNRNSKSVTVVTVMTVVLVVGKKGKGLVYLQRAVRGCSTVIYHGYVGYGLVIFGILREDHRSHVPISLKLLT
jgi:hypothetical protein